MMDDGETPDVDTIVPERPEQPEPLLVTTLDELGNEAFRGRSNVLFREDFLGDGDVLVEFRDERPVIRVEDFDVDRWKSTAPFGVGVRIVEHNQPSTDRFHMRQYGLIYVKASYGRLQKQIKKLEFVGLRRKTTGIIWKQKVHREYAAIIEMEDWG